MNWVEAPRQIFGRDWEGGAGKGVQGDALALSRRSCGPPVWCREENSDTDRECDSAPHPPGGAGGPLKSATEKTSRPHQGWSCTETVPLCTNARQQTETADLCLSSSLTHKQTTAHFAVLSILCYSGVFVLFFWQQDVILNESCTVMLLCSVVCSEVREARGLCFSSAPCFSFTWPRSSTPPSTHSWPTERFTAASAFQMRHSNREDTPTL